MKTCPKCAEQVQDAAKVCRYCQHKFGGDPVDVLKAIVAAGPLLLLGWCVLQLGKDPALDAQTATAASMPAAYSAERLAQCAKLIEEGERAGLIAERPAVNRVNVDERLWADLPATAKQGVAQGVACDLYRRPMVLGEYAVVYGLRTGKRLAQATSVGVNLE